MFDLFDRNISWISFSDGKTWNQVSRFHSPSDKDLLDSISVNSQSIRALSVPAYTQLLTLVIQADQAESVIDELLPQLTAIGIKTTHPYKLGKDDSIYLYISLTKTTHTNDIANNFQSWLQVIGLNQDVTVAKSGDKIGLPLQRSFQRLNNRLDPIVSRDDLSLKVCLSMFVRDLSTTKIDPEHLTMLLSQMPSNANNETGNVDQRTNTKVYLDCDDDEVDSCSSGHQETDSAGVLAASIRLLRPSLRLFDHRRIKSIPKLRHSFKRRSRDGPSFSPICQGRSPPSVIQNLV